MGAGCRRRLPHGALPMSCGQGTASSHGKRICWKNQTGRTAFSAKGDRKRHYSTPRTKTCPFTPASKDRFSHPNEHQSLVGNPGLLLSELGLADVRQEAGGS